MATSDADLSDWDDVLCAEPEKDFAKSKDAKKPQDSLGDEDDDDGWGDAVSIEVVENYCSTLMKQMEVFRKGNVLCNAVIVVDDRELPVHKSVLSAVSPFFKNIFSRGANLEGNRITLRNLTGQIMDDILHFSYTGEVCIHDGNVRQLVATANFLQLQSLKDMAVKYLERKLSPASAVEILILADKHDCQSLTQSAERIISENFVVVSKTDSFKKLKVETLLKLIKSEDIRVMKEEEVFEAVMAWIKSDFGDKLEKEKRLPDLLAEVRLPLISPSYLADIIEKDDLVRRSTLCQDMIREGKNYYLPIADHILVENHLCQPRKFMGVVWGIMSAGGWQEEQATKDVYAFISASFKWFPLTPLPEARYCHGTVSCDGFVYVLGGRDASTKLSRTVTRFDPSGNKWQSVAALPVDVASMGVAVYDGQIYVVGGLAAWGSLDMVLRYSARKNMWQPVTNLNVARGALCLVCDDHLLYAIGGLLKSGTGVKASWEHLSSMEVYQRESNKWEFSTPMLSARARASAVYINQQIYVIGGQSELLGACKGMDIFRTVTKEWITVPYMGVPRSMSGIAMSEGKFYLVGGQTQDGNAVNTFETYDATKDRWAKIASLPQANSAIQCCTFQLRLAVLQGLSTSMSE